MYRLAGGRMFTGLIESCSEVCSNIFKHSTHLLLIKNPFSDVQLGESISVNGVCLTVKAIHENTLEFDISPETFALTTLGALKGGDFVNIERALSAASRFGGHYVTGHVDTTAIIETLI